MVALIVEGFTLETADLAQELRMDALQLNKTFEMVGCNPIRRIGSAEGAAAVAGARRAGPACLLWERLGLFFLRGARGRRCWLCR